MSSSAAPEAGTVVVIEDEPAIADLVSVYLRRDGFRVLLAADGESGLAAVDQHRPDLVVLDLGLPGDLDGFDVCRRLRADNGGPPIVMLTARGDEVDRVVGLELGADDYLAKPFSPRELSARIKAVLRRTRRGPDVKAVLRHGPLELDPARRTAAVNGAPLDLTTREFDLLALLVAHDGAVLSRRQILDGAWGPGWIGDERTVDVHVSQLRRKLDGVEIATVRGVGYQLR